MLGLLAWVTIPSATTVTDYIGDYSTTFFDELIIPALMVVGLFIGVFLVKYLLLKVPMGAIKSFVGRGRRGRRRR